MLCGALVQCLMGARIASLTGWFINNIGLTQLLIFFFFWVIVKFVITGRYVILSNTCKSRAFWQKVHVDIVVILECVDCTFT